MGLARGQNRASDWRNRPLTTTAMTFDYSKCTTYDDTRYALWAWLLLHKIAWFQSPIQCSDLDHVTPRRLSKMNTTFLYNFLWIRLSNIHRCRGVQSIFRTNFLHIILQGRIYKKPVMYYSYHKQQGSMYFISDLTWVLQGMTSLPCGFVALVTILGE